jgi:hypothetical protein
MLRLAVLENGALGERDPDEDQAGTSHPVHCRSLGEEYGTESHGGDGDEVGPSLSDSRETP